MKNEELRTKDPLTSRKGSLPEDSERRVLIIGDVNSVFVRDFIWEMKMDSSLQIDVLTLSGKYENINVAFDNLYLLSRGRLRSASNFWLCGKLEGLRLLVMMARLLNDMDEYDVVHIHYLDPFYSFLANLIKRKAKRIFVSVWGSDFYRMSKKNRVRQKRILRHADVITFANDDLANEFSVYHNGIYDERIVICRFGLKPLEFIRDYRDRNAFASEIPVFLKKHNVDPNKFYITCGYNGVPAQQHKEIIEQICLLGESYLRDIVFLFPMTYGDAKYMAEIAEILARTNLNYRIFSKFMGPEEVAILRKVTNIMLHVQTTDQFSGSMQETLYAGNLVINGRWLPYDNLRQRGVFFLEVDRISELNSVIRYAIGNYQELLEKCKDNEQIIWDMSSWESNGKRWRDLYSTFLE